MKRLGREHWSRARSSIVQFTRELNETSSNSNGSMPKCPICNAPLTKRTELNEAHGMMKSSRLAAARSKARR